MAEHGDVDVVEVRVSEGGMVGMNDTELDEGGVVGPNNDVVGNVVGMILSMFDFGETFSWSGLGVASFRFLCGGSIVVVVSLSIYLRLRFLRLWRVLLVSS